jgi:hypothetical protein
MTRIITKKEAGLLVTKMDRTPEEDHELGRWWVRKLQRMLTRLEPVAALARDAQGRQDDSASARQVVAWAQDERSEIIGAATALASTERYAEFRTDFEDIAARAEAL